nr:hypothetical protein [Nostoc sp. EkiNYC01]
MLQLKLINPSAVNPLNLPSLPLEQRSLNKYKTKLKIKDIRATYV